MFKDYQGLRTPVYWDMWTVVPSSISHTGMRISRRPPMKGQAWVFKNGMTQIPETSIPAVTTFFTSCQELCCLALLITNIIYGLWRGNRTSLLNEPWLCERHHVNFPHIFPLGQFLNVYKYRRCVLWAIFFAGEKRDVEGLSDLPKVSSRQVLEPILFDFLI